jgi:aminopeptidase N
MVLFMTVDFDRQQLQVRADYELEQPVQGEFFMDTRGLDIQKVYAGKKEIEHEIDRRDPILGERLRLKDLNALKEFTIELATSSNASALQWLRPEQTSGGRQPFLYSQCFALHARSIFPCQDTPSVRFTYDAHIRVPEGLTAVMAAASLGSLDEGDTSIFSFKMPQPIPSYLFALAAGDIGFREIGPRTGIYAELPILDKALWEFAENEAKLEAAEKLFGTYLWDRYDILILPPSFPYGGMENPRLTFITPLSITGDRTMTRLISHELAHSWTGNLVTNATWEDFWLNEGWTTYVEYRLIELLDGEEILHLTDLFARIDLAEDMRVLGEESELTRLKAPMKGVDPDQVISAVPYTKGRLFLTSLEQAVGRPAFDEFLQRYIECYSFQSLTSEAFLEFLKAELPAAMQLVDVSQWLYQPGMPAGIPEIKSRLYDDVKAKADGYKMGIVPRREEVQGWHPLQKSIYFTMLPKEVSAKDCATLKDAFELRDSPPTPFLLEYYRLCIRSGYREALPEIQRFLGQVGRNAWLTYIYRAMLENEWTKPEARRIFEQVKARYHPITVTVVEGLLSKAGV